MPRLGLLTFLTYAIILFACAHGAFASLVNITIDDTYGDLHTGAQVTYSPATAWSAGSLTLPCLACPVQPDPAQLYNGTWHASQSELSSENLTASVSFNGSAVYVYASPSQERDTYLSFFIDNELVGTYVHAGSPPPDSEQLSYHIPVYVNLSMLAGPHTVTVQNGLSESGASFVILDSIVYTTDVEGDDETLDTASTSSSSPSISRPVMMGAVIGAVMGLIVLAILVYFCVRALRKRQCRRLAPSQQFYDNKWYYESGLSPLPTPRPDVEFHSWPAGDTSSRATPERQYESESEISVLPSSLRDHSSQPPRPPKIYHAGSLRSFMSRGRRSLRRSAPESDTTTAPYDPPVGEGRKFRVVNR